MQIQCCCSRHLFKKMVRFCTISIRNVLLFHITVYVFQFFLMINIYTFENTTLKCSFSPENSYKTSFLFPKLSMNEVDFLNFVFLELQLSFTLLLLFFFSFFSFILVPPPPLSHPPQRISFALTDI